MDQLTEQSVAWVLEQLNGELIHVEALKGGQSSFIHQLTVKMLDGKINKVVLREHYNAAWLAKEPRIIIQEAKNLKMMENSQLSTPKLIAYDEKMQQAGRPALLMTKVEGNIQLKPKNLSDWLNQIAQKLLSIHSVNYSGISHNYFAYYDKNNFIRPNWSTIPDKWGQCFDRLQNQERPDAEKRFIHRDYHPVNILWKEDKISGVVDWPNACVGPREIDLGHCRWNLCMMYGLDAADLFLKYYENSDRNFQYNYYWDLEALGNVYSDEKPQVYEGWPAFGLTNITEKIMIERMDQMLENALKKI